MVAKRFLLRQKCLSLESLAAVMLVAPNNSSIIYFGQHYVIIHKRTLFKAN
jgi:hypothetical protein